MPRNSSACGEFLPPATEQPEDKRTSLSHADLGTRGRACHTQTRGGAARWRPRPRSAEIHPPLSSKDVGRPHGPDPRKPKWPSSSDHGYSLLVSPEPQDRAEGPHHEGHDQPHGRMMWPPVPQLHGTDHEGNGVILPSLLKPTSQPRPELLSGGDGIRPVSCVSEPGSGTTEWAQYVFNKLKNERWIPRRFPDPPTFRWARVTQKRTLVLKKFTVFWEKWAALN